MLKIMFAAILITLAIAPSHAADSYVGVKLGKAKSNTAGAAYTPSTFGVLAGRMFDPNWAVEAEYLDLGNIAAANTSAISLSAVGLYPGNEPFSLFAKLGLAHTRWAAPDQVQGKSFLSYGLGGQYDFTLTESIRIGWELYKIGNQVTTKVEVLSVTGMIQF